MYAMNVTGFHGGDTDRYSRLINDRQSARIERALGMLH